MPVENVLLPFEQAVLPSAYADYLAARRNNWFATAQSFSAILRALGVLDTAWWRGLNSLGHPPDDTRVLATLLFGKAHYHFRNSLEFLLSGCQDDAGILLRSSIDSAAHGRRVEKQPHLAEIWLRQEDGNEHRKAFTAAFEKNIGETVFKGHWTLTHLYVIRGQLSNAAGHANLKALARHWGKTTTDDSARFEFQYFQVEPENLKMHLLYHLTAARLLFELFADSFRERLQFDLVFEAQRKDSIAAMRDVLSRHFGSYAEDARSVRSEFGRILRQFGKLKSR
jgi:hypothetical protein